MCRVYQHPTETYVVSGLLLYYLSPLLTRSILVTGYILCPCHVSVVFGHHL
jgi:hypothetical protein